MVQSARINQCNIIEFKVQMILREMVSDLLLVLLTERSFLHFAPRASLSHAQAEWAVSPTLILLAVSKLSLLLVLSLLQDVCRMSTTDFGS